MKCEGMKLIYPILSGGWNSRGWNLWGMKFVGMKSGVGGVKFVGMKSGGDEIRGDEIWGGW